ncbi:MAG: hypothetical protein Q9207_003574 [Kuettlingeria erythrocarpa]
MASSIGDEINLATRSFHTTLNQLILHQLPLALPPNTPSHQLYALGISHFQPLYSIFEGTYRDHLGSAVLPQRVAEILRKLHLPSLERAQALENDIRTLLPQSYRAPHTTNDSNLEAFKRHVSATLTQKPHLVIAYTWIFYMALFSGGRYIRSKLRVGLAASMASVASAAADQLAGLSFWDFPGEHDGEDLKIEYKSRVTAVSALLTEQERADIIDEGVKIMVLLTDVVREVAEVVPRQALELALETTSGDKDIPVPGPVSRIRPPWLLLVRSLFPFGIMEAVSAFMATMPPRSSSEQRGVNLMPVQLKAE